MGNRLRLPRSFWLTVAGLCCWMGLPSGIYFAASGYFGVPTFLLLVVGLASLGVLVDGRLPKKLEAREIPSGQLAGAILLWGGVGMLEVYQLLTVSPSGPGGSLVLTIVTLGDVVLLGAALWQVAVAWRSQTRL